ERHGPGHAQRRRGHHHRAMLLDEGPPDGTTDMRRRDVQADPVVATLEPGDLARLRLVDAVLDRALLADELLHRALVLDELVLVAAPLGEAVAGDADARERVGEPLRRELDGEPALVARPQSAGRAEP